MCQEFQRSYYYYYYYYYYYHYHYYYYYNTTPLRPSYLSFILHSDPSLQPIFTSLVIMIVTWLVTHVKVIHSFEKSQVRT